jgi:predicted transcriptional regulator
VSNDTNNRLDLVADIVSAYLSNNTLAAGEIAGLISAVNSAIQNVATGKVEEVPVELKPAVPVKKSITPDAIICLEDGKAFKSLKRHLMTKYGMTPAEYRTKWGLPKDYPMVAPNYAAARSALARNMGLGLDRRKSEPEKVARKPRKAKADA